MKRRRTPRRESFECPHCGADVPIGSPVCRECGSDADTGWQDGAEIDYRSIEIPDGYGPDEHASGTTSTGPRRWIVVTALVVAAALVCWLVAARW
ncbi:MAG: hypothetical protein JNM25_15065 [Planctomycetes bacterium]|nr:hypothetical protein [Planctomycetota bacterium]